MPKGNVENLRSVAELSTEERREMARNGGIKSGETRRRQKTLREIANAMLQAELLDTDAIKAELVARGMEPTGGEAMLLAQVLKANKGDTEAARFVRDTSGQKPSEVVELTGLDGGPIVGADLSSLTDEQLARLVSARDDAPTEG